MEKIRNHLIVPALEDDISHTLVMFRVSELGLYPIILRFKVAETNFQRQKEKVSSVRKVRVVLQYRRTQFVCHRCRAAGALFPLCQVKQHAWEEITWRAGGVDG